MVTRRYIRRGWGNRLLGQAVHGVLSLHEYCRSINKQTDFVITESHPICALLRDSRQSIIVEKVAFNQLQHLLNREQRNYLHTRVAYIFCAIPMRMPSRSCRLYVNNIYNDGKYLSTKYLSVDRVRRGDSVLWKIRCSIGVNHGANTIRHFCNVLSCHFGAELLINANDIHLLDRDRPDLPKLRSAYEASMKPHIEDNRSKEIA